jgi:hypothetical protein
VPRFCKYVARVMADQSEFAALFKAATEYANGSDRWVEIQAGYMAFYFEAYNAYSTFCLYVAGCNLQLITSEDQHEIALGQATEEAKKAATKPKPCFSDNIRKLFKDWKQDKLLEEFEGHRAELLERRVDVIQYGDPDKLSAKKRTILNSQVLRQALLHRAECLLVGSGQMMLAKNVYGLALVARGHLEATAVLAHFCNRLDALSKGHIQYETFDKDVANAIMGAQHELFDKADFPKNIMTCIEKGDKFLDDNIFGKKVGLLSDCYRWLSEFAHPNFCSNKSSFTLDKATGSMAFRHDGDLQESDFQLVGYLEMSAAIFHRLFDILGEKAEKVLAE